MINCLKLKNRYIANKGRKNTLESRSTTSQKTYVSGMFLTIKILYHLRYCPKTKQ